MNRLLDTNSRYATKIRMRAFEQLICGHSQITIHQGFIEGAFGDALLADGLIVDRPVTPVSLEISQDENELRDPTAYPLTVTTLHILAVVVNLNVAPTGHTQAS